MQTDILIVGSGCAGLYCALNLPKNKNILMITNGTFQGIQIIYFWHLFFLLLD